MSLKLNLKKALVFVLFIALVCGVFAGVAVLNERSGGALASEEDTDLITLQIGNPEMTVNGETMEVDPGRGTAPVLSGERTLVPVRALIEALGGSVQWNEEEEEATLTLEGDEIRLVIGSMTAYLNGEAKTLDAAPELINERTMLPIRFIAESFNFEVEWEEENQLITINSAGTNSETNNSTGTNPETNHNTGEDGAPVVYMTTEISPEALNKIYSYLGFEPEGKVAVKLSTGEAGNTHYLDPNLIKDLVQMVDGTIVECNTAYGGSRASTAVHMQTAEDHGFTAIADVDIMDADGTMQLPVSDKAEVLEYDIVGKNYANYDSMLVLSHFKGHAMGGFGGAIKNISIGVASQNGKMYIHSGGHSDSSWSGGTQDQFLEAMAEAAQAVHNDKTKDGGIVYISVMNHLSVDCDCDGNPAEPKMDDVGILASYDPVALDQACVDIVYNTDIAQSGDLRERIESRNGIHTLEHAEKIGLGSRSYKLVSIDE